VRPDIRINHPRSKTPKTQRVTNELAVRLRKATDLKVTNVFVENKGWQATLIFEEDVKIEPLLINVVRTVTQVMRDLGNVTVLDVHGHTIKTDPDNMFHYVRITVKLHKEKAHVDGRKSKT